MCTVEYNNELNGIEISFDSKPEQAIIQNLKSSGFRWHNVKKLWYAKQTEERIKLAVSLSGDEQTTAADNVKTKAQSHGTPQNHIAFYWNGIKVDGKLVTCYYSTNNDSSVALYAKEYSGDLPRDLFEVINESDSYTDYFEKDRATIKSDHPLYKYARYAAIKSKVHELNRSIKWKENRIASGSCSATMIDCYKKEIAADKERLANYEKEANPGQPTQEDLDLIDKARQEAENARKAAEHEEELREREKYLNDRCNGRKLIEKMQETYPIEEGKPVVTILWSESPKFAAYEDGELKLSVAAADVVLRTFDKERVAEYGEHSGYDKTKFQIDFINKDGEQDNYIGRYDLGDNENGLIDHIRSFGKWYLTHDQFGHELETPLETNENVEFANWLESTIETDIPNITIKTLFGQATVTRDQALRFAKCRYQGITTAKSKEERLEMVNQMIVGTQFTVEDLEYIPTV